MAQDDNRTQAVSGLLEKVSVKPLISELPPPDAANDAPFSAPARPVSERPGRILIMVVRPDRRQIAEQLVRDDGYEGRFISPTDDLLAATAEFEPDVILLSAMLPNGYALELVSELRAEEKQRHTPVVLLGDTDGELDVAKFLLSGADDYVMDIRRQVELRARVRVQLRNKRFYDALHRVRGERDNFRRHANLDPLTGIMNRRALEQHLALCHERRERYGFLFFDLDHFKGVNDDFGHDVGDYVLELVARTAECCIRPGDALARYGGEEFVVVLCDAPLEVTRSVAERLRSAVETLRLPRDGPAHVSVSVGATVYDPSEEVEPSEHVVRRADRALYLAKQRGRNRVEMLKVSDPLPPAPGSTRPSRGAERESRKLI